MHERYYNNDNKRMIEVRFTNGNTRKFNQLRHLVCDDKFVVIKHMDGNRECIFIAPICNVISVDDSI